MPDGSSRAQGGSSRAQGGSSSAEGGSSSAEGGSSSAQGGSSSAQGGALAERLAEAHRRLVALELPDPAVGRLHRQFIAVCDAVKAEGADTGVAERRLAAFLEALERACRINEYGSRPQG